MYTPTDRRRNPLVDANLLIPMGVFPGVGCINKFGRNILVTDAADEEVWDGAAPYVFPATALMTKLSQTTDQTAMRAQTIEIEGLDGDMAYVKQNVVLDGTLTTTAVTLGTALKRVFRMRCLSAVVGDSPIRLHNTAENQDYAIILAGANQTQMAMYSVPTGKKAYMTGYYATINPGVGNPTALNIAIYVVDNANGYAKQLKHSVGLDLDFTAHIQHDFKPYIEIPAQADVYVVASPTGANADVQAGFDLIVVDQ